MDYESALDELFAAPPEDFVAERSRLAKELKADGRKVEAERLAKVRKPPLAAWVLNRLVRDHRREVDLLLHSGHRLRAAQAGVLRGAERDAFEQARRTEREAIESLVREAAKLLRARGSASDTVLKQVEDTLRAAAVSDEGRELLASGRFTQLVEGGGFELLTGLAPKTPVSRSRAPAKKQHDEEARRKAKAELADAKAQLRAAERAARAAEAEVDAATRAVDRAQARLDRL